jgi:thioredoxin 1
MTLRVLCFVQEGCMGCEEQQAINREVQDNFAITIEQIDAVRFPEYIKTYNLRVTPTIVLLCNGQEQSRFEGIVHREELEAEICRCL